MLKKIHVRNIRSGMFINEICGSWMDHPFWNKAFLLSSDADLKTLQTCGIHEVWIDTEKGLDVESIAIISTAEEEKKGLRPSFLDQHTAQSQLLPCGMPPPAY